MHATYLSRRGGQRSPINAGHYVEDQVQVDLKVVLHELGILGVQRVRTRRRLAGLDGASQEVQT